MSKIIILMGSSSDQSFSQKIKEELKKYSVEIIEQIASAHKVPELVLEIVQKNNQSDENICYITIAGRSNGLSGVIAANSIHPVIACPPFQDKTDFQVNINSTLQMPSQTPVLTVVDPKNAAEAAIRILSNNDKGLREQVIEGIKKMKESFKII